MKNNYKRIGDYIQLVDNRNKELAVSNLLGVSIQKKFIPSIANIPIGVVSILLLNRVLELKNKN